MFQKQLNKHTDEELMVEVIDHHSHSALNELHHRYSKKLLGYFIKMLNRDEHLAQDFVQELFLKILEKKHLFDTNKKFYTWVFTIASNMCKSSYRRKPMHSLSENTAEGNPSFYVQDNLSDKERFQVLLTESIDNLEHHHKTVFVLRYMVGFSLKEIADITDVSTGTVKSRLFYATKNMMIMLKEYDPRCESNYFKL